MPIQKSRSAEFTVATDLLSERKRYRRNAVDYEIIARNEFIRADGDRRHEKDQSKNE